MSLIRLFALSFGVVFLLVGGCGFVPAFLSPPMPGHTDMLMTHAFDGRLFGLFHVNAVHSAAHLLFGLLGLAACGRSSTARVYAGFVFLAYAGLAVLGLFPATNTMGGMAPMNGNDVWLHVFLAAVGGIFAFLVPAGRASIASPTVNTDPAPLA